VVVVDVDATGAGIGGVVVVCSLVVVLVSVSGLLQPAANKAPAVSAAIVNIRSPGIMSVMASLQYH